MEAIKNKFRDRPIFSSLISVLAVMILWWVLGIIALGLAGRMGLQGVPRILDGSLRLIAAIPAIYLLGVLIEQNGLKFTFSPKAQKGHCLHRRQFFCLFWRLL
jgi:hypothetical protein